MLRESDAVISRILVRKRLVKQEVLDALIREKEVSGASLVSLLSARGIISEDEVLRLLADELGLSYLDLRNTSIDKSGS